MAKYTEYKSPICAMGVFRSQTPRACECSPILSLHPNPTFSLTTIYRSVARSRPTHWRKKIYHRKLQCIPTFSKYSCRAFSLSSSVGAVLYFVYKSRLTIASNFSSKPFFISDKTSSLSTKWYLRSAINNSSEICTFFNPINPSFPSRPQQRNVYTFCNLAKFITANYI